MNLQIREDAFFCSVCDSSLTIYAENKGKGFRAHCKLCRKTYYYPACEECGQGTWRHDEIEHLSIVARNSKKGFCRKCITIKELSEFNIKEGKPTARCKSCQSEYFRNWYNKKKPHTITTDKAIFDDILNELFGDI